MVAFNPEMKWISLSFPARGLNFLAKNGIPYLATDDDGETWRGSHHYGLEILKLLKSRMFFGKIDVDYVPSAS